jgi:ketosteroid isomerase-like protein
MASALTARHHGAVAADDAEHDDAEDAVRGANAAFYAAFGSRDLDAMSTVWEHSDRVAVTHPGWPLLRGWARVLGSWDAIFANTAYIQFVLTDEVVTVEGDAAWVTLDENILQSVGAAPPGAALQSDDLSGARIAATNVFARDDGVWKLVVHHGSPVSASADLEPGDPEPGGGLG